MSDRISFKKSVHAVLLAGGSGTRLWPLSREEFPKQFLTLHGEDSLFRGTLDRFSRSVEGVRFCVVAAKRWEPIIQHQAQTYVQNNNLRLIEEPSGKNTAPAVLLAVLALLENGAAEDDILIVSPSDHIISQEEPFSLALKSAIATAKESRIALLGIVPTYPESGFGYIQAKITSGENALLVDRFVEKPKKAIAQQYLQEGGWFWNGGIFVFTPRTFMREIALHCPALASGASLGLDSYLNAWGDLPSISLDHALMEKTNTLSLVPLDAGWCDIGSWDAVRSLAEKDGDGNVYLGDVISQNCSNNLVISRKRLATLSDVEGLLVVDSPDALFIGKKDHSGNLRTLTETLKGEARRELVEAQESARAWGTYEVLHRGEGVKIRRVVVEPGREIGLQYHTRRSEHWIITSGTAHVTLEGALVVLEKGQSAFISQNQTHRLENRGSAPLHVIEIQQGDDLSEDDIIRVDARKKEA